MGPTLEVPSFLRAFENKDLNGLRGNFLKTQSFQTTHCSEYRRFLALLHRNRNRSPAELRPKLPSPSAKEQTQI